MSPERPADHGFAAADTLCARHLGQHNSGENHHEATALLRRL